MKTHLESWAACQARCGGHPGNAGGWRQCLHTTREGCFGSHAREEVGNAEDDGKARETRTSPGSPAPVFRRHLHTLWKPGTVTIFPVDRKGDKSGLSPLPFMRVREGNLMDIARFAALAAAVLASSPALPESTYLPPYTVLSTENIYTVNLDGTYSEEVREAYRINTQDGITQLAQVPLYFSGERDELEVLSAETVTANGRTVPVPRESILLQQDAMSAHGPIYDDLKVKNVIFPALGIGAVLRLSYRYRQKTALFPGEFFMLEGFPRRDEYKSALVEINAPATLPLHVQAEGMHGGEIATGKPGLRSWRWTLMDASAAPPETGSVSDIDFSPRIIASTFADYDAVARAYWDGASAKQRSPPRSGVWPNR